MRGGEGLTPSPSNLDTFDIAIRGPATFSIDFDIVTFAAIVIFAVLVIILVTIIVIVAVIITVFLLSHLL